MNPTLTATIKATGERIRLYKLNNGNYYDFDNMGANQPPSAPKANKKEFTKDKLTSLQES